LPLAPLLAPPPSFSRAWEDPLQPAAARRQPLRRQIPLIDLMISPTSTS
jgi:hypothetical protein